MSRPDASTTTVDATGVVLRPPRDRGRIAFIDFYCLETQEEWQLSCSLDISSAYIAGNDAMSSSKTDSLPSVWSMRGIDEAQASRRGLRALRCQAFHLQEDSVLSEADWTGIQLVLDQSLRRQENILCKSFKRCGICKIKGCDFRHYFNTDAEREATEVGRRRRAAMLSPGHYESNSKCRRHDIFAAWLATTMQADGLVLDVAGGSAGRLSWALWRRGFECISIDPRLQPFGKTRRQRKEINKHLSLENCIKVPIPKSLALSFDMDFEAQYATLLARTSLIIGLHADEVTEQIVDIAIKYGTRLAIVPCCVFPQLFPDRRLLVPGSSSLQRPVLTTRDFEQYLLAKHPTLRIAHLSFQGRNSVIFRDTLSQPLPQHPIALPADANHLTACVQGDRWREIQSKRQAA